VLQQRYYVDDFRSAAVALSSDLAQRPAPVAVIRNWTAVGFAYYATPPPFAHALNAHAIQAYNRDALSRIGVVGWPAGAKLEAATGRCHVGWAIGRAGRSGVVLSKTVAIDGSSCRVYRVRYYGEVWVASLGG
jgi:hypothetical protein